MSGGDAAKKKLRKKLERELQINLRDIFLIWSSTILGVFMTYFFENGINQYRAGFVMPEMYHIVIDPIIFVGVFMFGALIYTSHHSSRVAVLDDQVSRVSRC